MTQKIIIQGGRQLYGDVVISGMKNAALPILFATILTRGTVTLENIPPISDISVTLQILSEMGATVNYLNRTTVRVDTTYIEQGSAPIELTSRLRASTYLLGAELGRFRRASAGWPGGCNFGGERPLNQHFKSFEMLGASDRLENGYICLDAPDGLHGNTIYLDFASVGTTVNIILAAVTAEGTTVIDNAAREPHIVDLANFLNTCGANITGAGTPVIKIRGVSELHGGCTYAIIPDMIEAGTYMTAAAATGGRVMVRSVIPKHLETITAKLTEMGVRVVENDDSVVVESTGTLRNVNIRTLPYPGFPTDMHPQFAPLLCLAEGISSIQEGVWETRFRYVDELRKMGANIMLDFRNATFIGGGKLTGAMLTAPDMRAGAALVIAGLAAEGRTEISRVEYIDRGYYDFVNKLRILGANISSSLVPDAEDELIPKAN